VTAPHDVWVRLRWMRLAGIVTLMLTLSIGGWLAPVAVPPTGAQEQSPASSTGAPSDGTTTGTSTLQEFLRGSSEGISANPGAVNVVTGTGMLGRFLGFGPDSGVRLGGMWIGDASYLFAGGNDARTWSFNSLLIVDLNLDLEKILQIPGAKFGASFLQFNGQDTNEKAGAVTGYDGLTGPPPLNRSELYELWWRQGLFDDKLIIRIGKTVPTYDFNNVLRPLRLENDALAIPAISSLIYTPVFKNPTLVGAMPGYYNSAYGVTVTVAPTTNFYVSAAAFDGNLARGVQTGINAAPEFNGYYFSIGEVGYSWRLGPDGMPGTVAVGGWGQTGQLTAPTPSGSTITENGAKGIYAFANQRLWIRNPGIDNSGLSGFVQFGIHDSETMIAKTYVGAGLTGFGLIPGRPRDSVGAGVAVSWLNQRLGFRNNEVILAAYYQLHLIADVYLQPTVTYIPNPGASPKLSPATAISLWATMLF
jgi:porin